MRYEFDCVLSDGHELHLLLHDPWDAISALTFLETLSRNNALYATLYDHQTHEEYHHARSYSLTDAREAIRCWIDEQESVDFSAAVHKNWAERSLT